jgi:hypothetical protein
MKLKKRPDWEDDDDKVAEWVIVNRRHALLRAMGLEESQAAIVQIGKLKLAFEEQIYSLEEADPEPSEEEKAVGAAMRGKPEALADLVKAGVTLSPATRQLAAELLTGKRNPKTGHYKSADNPGGGGRAKMSKAERAERTPTHHAANYCYPAVMQVLQQEYPPKPEWTDKDKEDYYQDRVLYIVWCMTGAKADTVEKYLMVKNDPRKI